jgi:hypothetical protein
LLDTQIGDHDVDIGKLRQIGIVDCDRCVEHLAHRQHFAWALLEVS